MSNFKPSKYQTKIFNFIKTGKGNAVVSAVAGSGKTTTLLEALKLIPLDKTVLFLAFNKSIAEELKVRVPKTKNIEVTTVHGLGYKTLSLYYDIKCDNRKYRRLLRNIFDWHSEKDKKALDIYGFDSISMDLIKNIIKSNKSDEDTNPQKFLNSIIDLCNLGRLHLVDSNFKNVGLETLNELAAIHNIDNNSGESEMAWYLIKLGLSYLTLVDFTDMIYIPNVFKLKTKTYDYVFIDECQDLNICQRMLMESAIEPIGGRFIAVGDPKQAIYAFAGADYKSFMKICEIPNTIQLPLSETYRCGSEIVKMVTHINPDIKSHKNNGKGEIIHEYSHKDVQDGDMVLCRQTLPVVSLCVKYLSEGKRAFIIGSDIGLSLINMINDCKRVNEEFTMKNVFSRLYHDKDKLIEKVMTTNNISKEDASEDNLVISYIEKVQVIEAISVGIEKPEEVINKIKNIFSDDKKVGICLSTIHKSKGLESDNVYILQKELMPSKYAILPWQIEQEENLRYVAYTRARKRLGFITDFDAFKSHKSQSENVKKVVESKHIGRPGAKMWLDLTVVGVRNVTTKYNTEVKIYDLKDSNNNMFAKFGDIGDRFISDNNTSVKPGTKVSFYAIINQHNEFRGMKTTNIGKISSH